MSRTKVEREPYKPKHVAELEAIDSRRRELGASIEALARQAGMGERGVRRILKSGRAWKREILALRMAVRSIERDQKAEAELFSGGGGDETTGAGGTGRS